MAESPNTDDKKPLTEDPKGTDKKNVGQDDQEISVKALIEKFIKMLLALFGIDLEEKKKKANESQQSSMHSILQDAFKKIAQEEFGINEKDFQARLDKLNDANNPSDRKSAANDLINLGTTAAKENGLAKLTMAFIVLHDPDLEKTLESNPNLQEIADENNHKHDEQNLNAAVHSIADYRLEVMKALSQDDELSAEQNLEADALENNQIDNALAQSFDEKYGWKDSEKETIDISESDEMPDNFRFAQSSMAEDISEGMEALNNSENSADASNDSGFNCPISGDNFSEIEKFTLVPTGNDRYQVYSADGLKGWAEQNGQPDPRGGTNFTDPNTREEINTQDCITVDRATLGNFAQDHPEPATPAPPAPPGGPSG